jgi:hypothetical protein
MKPGDLWINWPYFIGCPLYPYHPELPEPIMALTGDEFREALRKRPANHDCFVLVATSDQNADPALKQTTWRVEYPNGMVLLKLSPKTEGPRE